MKKGVVQLYNFWCVLCGSLAHLSFLPGPSSPPLTLPALLLLKGVVGVLLGGLLGELDAQDKMAVTVAFHLLACNGGI